MDVFHTRFNGSCVAYSRYLGWYIAALADALCSDTLERIVACKMPLRIKALIAFANKQHANLALRIPLPVCYAFEWVLFEIYKGRRTDIDSRLVANSILYLVTFFYCFIPYNFGILLT